MAFSVNGATGSIWTREAIICAIQRWVIEYGEPPTSKVWAAGYRPRPRGVLGHLDPEWTIERFANAGRSR